MGGGTTQYCLFIFQRNHPFLSQFCLIEVSVSRIEMEITQIADWKALNLKIALMSP